MIRTVDNFGRNISFRCSAYYAPRSEADVLSILSRHRGQRIRAIGRRHSWSRAVVAQDVLIDLRHLDAVTVTHDRDDVYASIGAGCPLERALRSLRREAGVTLPTVGLIAQQTIAGAISTGTHGSGKPSLSHFIHEIRIAHYGENGEPRIRTVRDGDALRALRCAIGCAGIIVAVRLRCRPTYGIEEHLARYATLDDVLARHAEYPLQQFFLVPWSWQFVAQHRRECTPKRTLRATLHHLYWTLWIDIALHTIIKCLVKVDRPAWTRAFFRGLPHFVVRGVHVVDRAERLLVMRHERFRHIEIEVFVTGEQLAEALAFVRESIEYVAGQRATLSRPIQAQLRAIGRRRSLDAIRYHHHYPICVRRVESDDTLISMATDATRYAISLISYEATARRAGFVAFASFIADSMARLFAARCHWGKVCPTSAEQHEALYPQLDRFRRIVAEFDPHGRFQNDWIADALGLAGEQSREASSTSFDADAGAAGG